MEVFRITKCSFIDDLSGKGAFLYGGRWNSEGYHALYTASSASLALLETLAHVTHLPLGFCIACITIPDEEILVYDSSKLPEMWHVSPAPTTLQLIGDNFIKENKYLSIQFPSAILPEDNVVLINPKHPSFKKVKIKFTRQMEIDKRLYHK